MYFMDTIYPKYSPLRAPVRLALRFTTVLVLLLAGGVAGAQTLPPPTSYVGSDSTRIPVYKGFSTLAPLFAQRGDTTLIVNFWATWCAPCVEELPHFEELTRTRGDAAYRVILVSLDFPKQLETRLLPFVRKHGLRSTVVVLDDPDANAWIDRVDPEWSGAIPATLVFNSRVREFREQSFSRNELRTFIHSLTGTTE